MYVVIVDKHLNLRSVGAPRREDGRLEDWMEDFSYRSILFDNRGIDSLTVKYPSFYDSLS